MRVVLIGATGFIGSKILAEALDRGHYVTALCRHPESVGKHERVRAVRVEVTDTSALAREFEGHDAVIHSYAPPRDALAVAAVEAAVATGKTQLEAIVSYAPRDPAVHDAGVQSRIDQQIAGTRSIIQAAKAANVKRILAVGGAGTLLIDGVRSMDRPGFPKAFEGGAKSTAVVKELLRETTGIEWTVLCPSTSISPGQRTGKFRVGSDDLLTAPNGSSSISLEDYAMAMIDELENPQHSGHRFTVGY